MVFDDSRTRTTGFLTCKRRIQINTACWNSWYRARVMPLPAARRPNRFSFVRSIASGWPTGDWDSSWCGMVSFQTLDWFTFSLIPNFKKSSTRKECRSSRKPSAAGNSTRRWTRSFFPKCLWAFRKLFRIRPVKKWNRPPLELSWRERQFLKAKCALPPEWQWTWKKLPAYSAEKSWLLAVRISDGVRISLYSPELLPNSVDWFHTVPSWHENS